MLAEGVGGVLPFRLNDFNLSSTDRAVVNRLVHRLTGDSELLCGFGDGVGFLAAMCVDKTVYK